MGESGRAQIDANRVRCARHESIVTRHNATRRDGAVRLTVPPTLAGLGWAVPSDGGSTPTTTTTTTASSDPRSTFRLTPGVNAHFLQGISNVVDFERDTVIAVYSWKRCGRKR
ncbi:uncharacterized protein Dmoj_GI12263, isoform D [Drosophila mojavensis]|uniref:Uncharacterized protein, isoform C n=1 Tax=Drosophila mojavensis TaxID=7230 RepID=A0A0Q9XBS3_DROMO|nr:uncharacterized protein Dmoj_GI12263, isoform C [Drosophila mojavensis]KRG05990.1 uncharacterized protein Dmoj_GI12263, isoform D [Drosophila mojavensis]